MTKTGPKFIKAKHNLIRAAVAVMFLFLAFVLSGCKPGDAPDGDTGGAPGNEIAVVSGGAANYVVVRGDMSSDSETASALKLIRAIETATGVKPVIATDWDDGADNSSRREILVGKTNRAKASELLSLLSDSNGYIVRAEDNYIILAGGTDDATADAVDYFIENYVKNISGGDFILNADINHTGSHDTSPALNFLRAEGGAAYSDDLEKRLSALTTKFTAYTYGDDMARVFAPGTALVVIEDATELPAGAFTAIDNYLKNGGRLLTLGGRPFESPLYENNGKWLTKADYFTVLGAESGVKNIALDTSKRSFATSLNRGTNNPDSATKIKTITDAAAGARITDDPTPSIKITVPALKGWDIYALNVSVPDGDNAVGFWAKGGEKTDSLYFEVVERDKSRWTAAVALTGEWSYHILTAADFTYYSDNASVGRGGAGDKCNIQNAASFSFGLALSHQASLGMGAHEYYIDDLATLQFSLDGVSLEVCDGIWPAYKFYTITNAAKLAAWDNQTVAADADYAVADGIVSVFPGRQGTGYNKTRVDRFVPLIEVTDKQGLHSGYAAWIYYFSSTSETYAYEGSALCSFGAPRGSVFYDTAGLDAVADAAKTLLGGAYLIEGGSEEYLYVDSETNEITVGASCAAGSSDGLSLRLEYGCGGDMDSLEVNLTDCKVVKTVGGLSYYTYASKLGTSDFKPDKINVSLLRNGEVIDRISHEIKFWSPKPENKRSYVYTENGNFMRDGKILKLFGINYMPSSGAGVERWDIFNDYTRARSYDPDVIRADLLRLKSLGYNALSLFGNGYTNENNNNLLHLVSLCGELGFYADVYVGMYPFATADSDVAGRVEYMIKRPHLGECDNVVAYDLAWESTIGKYDGGSITAGGQLRRDLDPAWREWIDEQYGSVGAAETVWGVSAPRDGSGKVIGATDAMLRETGGKSAALAAAYRRFLDDAVAARFNETVSRVRGLVPNQLISFRMQTSGSPSSDPAECHYDFNSLASALDFMSPEGYAINVNAKNYLEGVFANTYARYASPGAPVVWKEFGYSVWSGTNDAPLEPKLRDQAEYYRAMYEMMLSGDTAACYNWYSIGGYRYGENSDYGIINPDGSDRPVTAVIREYSAKFLAAASSEADYFIEIDRDAHPDSITGIYKAVKSELEKAVTEGHTVAFVSAGDKLTAAQAVEQYGAKPGPVKFLNGQIMSVKSDGGKYTVTVKNTGRAKWEAANTRLAVRASDGALLSEVILGADLGYLDEATVSFTVPDGAASLSCVCNGRLFGHGYKIK